MNREVGMNRRLGEGGQEEEEEYRRLRGG